MNFIKFITKYLIIGKDNPEKMDISIARKYFLIFQSASSISQYFYKNPFLIVFFFLGF